MQHQNPTPKRKLPRLHRYDYAQNGYYFVTICSAHRSELFSQILHGIAPDSSISELTGYGKAIEYELLQLPLRFPGITIDKYVVMPNHIHAIIVFQQAVPFSLSDVICAFKSLATRRCKQIHPISVVFQKSFHDHIIRGQADYEMIWSYIDANPMNWNQDCFYPKLDE